MIKVKKEDEEEQEFDDWLERVVIVDKEKVPIVPKLVVDDDEGEDGE